MDGIHLWRSGSSRCVSRAEPGPSLHLTMQSPMAAPSAKTLANRSLSTATTAANPVYMPFRPLFSACGGARGRGDAKSKGMLCFALLKKHERRGAAAGCPALPSAGKRGGGMGSTWGSVAVSASRALRVASSLPLIWSTSAMPVEWAAKGCHADRQARGVMKWGHERGYERGHER